MIFTPTKPLVPEFTPKSLTMTFQTQEEYDLLHSMMGYGVSIPSLVVAYGAKDFVVQTTKLAAIMRAFRLAMKEMK